MGIMKRKFLTLVFVLSGMLTACSKPANYTDLQGDAVALDHPQWQVLNFWASWCEPCREEIPELNALASDGKVRVLGVDFDNSQGVSLADKVSALGIRFTVLQQSPLPVLGAPPPQVLPATYILTPEGQVVDKLFGSQTKASLEQRIYQLSQ